MGAAAIARGGVHPRRTALVLAMSLLCWLALAAGQAPVLSRLAAPPAIVCHCAHCPGGAKCCCCAHSACALGPAR